MAPPKTRKQPRNSRRPQRREWSLQPPARLGDWGRVRLLLVAVCFGLAWMALWVRAYQVQIVMGPELAEKASRQHVTAEHVTGERGQIFDRKGRLLAKSVQVHSVYGSPREVDDPAATARALSKILDMAPATIAKRLQGDGHFAWIARKVGDREAVAVETADLTGVHLVTEYSRQYPNRSLAGRLIGFVGLDDRGLEGLEASYDRILAGRKERIVVQRDAAGHTMYPDVPDAATLARGRDLTLTLDLNIQFAAEEALAKAVQEHQAVWGGCMVVHVKTGDVLAWAEYPLFNPNAFAESSPARWRNRMALDALEPGSTMKPFLFAAALQERVLDRNSMYFCEEGRWKVGGATITDTHEYGWLPAHKVVRYSSNICSAKIGMELGAERYENYLRALGFGEKTGLPLPGESSGIVRPAAAWRTVDLAAASFGQSVAVTTPQLVQAYLALANGGVRKPLRLVIDPQEPAGAERRVFSREVAQEVLAVMRDVVEEDGTGANARIAHLEVGGKTGTAQKASPQGGYGDKYLASFVGLLPAAAPEYVVAVVVDEPEPNHYGGVVAAPAFKETALKTLAYVGDLPAAPIANETVLAAEAAAAAVVEQGGAPEREKENAHVAEKVRESAGSRKAVVRAPVVTRDAQAAGGDGRVPDVVGLSLRRAMELFVSRGVVPRLEGEGPVVARQSPGPGQSWPMDGETGAGCVLWLGHRES